MKTHLDFETRSTVDLLKVGAWNYAMHPSTEILCMGFTMDAGALGGRIEVLSAADIQRIGPIDWKDKIISAHNAQFEYAIYNCILYKRYGWPERWDPKLWSCTLARAAMVGLPLSLDSLGRALKIKTPKDLEGRAVMQRLCKPVDFDALGAPIYDNDPVKFKRL